MSISKTQESALTAIYSMARRSGLLDTGPGQWLFSNVYFLYKRYLEDPFHALIKRRPTLLAGGHVLDIGANIGYTALLFSRAIDPGFKVYAFEPEAYNFSLLSRVAGSPKSRGRIVASQSAVGDRDGTVELCLNKHHHGDHRIMTPRLRETSSNSGSARVPILKIDTFVESQTPPFPVRFIKVDVQGYETAVCKGMEQTLKTNPQAILALEYMPQAMAELDLHPQELLDWIEQRQYRVYCLAKDGTVTPGLPKLSSEGYADLLVSREPL